MSEKKKHHESSKASSHHISATLDIIHTVTPPQASESYRTKKRLDTKLFLMSSGFNASRATVIMSASVRYISLQAPSDTVSIGYLRVLA